MRTAFFSIVEMRETTRFEESLPILPLSLESLSSLPLPLCRMEERERERQSGANRTTIESPLVHWIWFQSDRYYLVSCSMYSCDKSEIDGILVQISIFLIMWSDNNTFILAIIKILVFFELQSINPLFKRGQRGDTVTGLNCELTFFFFPRCPRKT